MMKVLILFPILAVTLLSTGCGDKAVLTYANTLSRVLAQYGSQLDLRIKSDQRLYRDLVEVFAVEAERDVYESLSIERHQQSVHTSNLLMEEKASLSDASETIRKTALSEFDRTRTYFETEMAGPERFSPALKVLRVDAKKIDALKHALDDLAATPALKDRLTDLIASRDAFQTEFDLQACKDLSRRVGTATDGLADLNDEKQSSSDEAGLDKRISAVKSQVASWQAQLKDRNCQ